MVASQAFWASLMSSNYQIAVGDWGFPIADCDSVFPFLHSSTAGGNNFSPIIDKKMTTVRTAGFIRADRTAPGHETVHIYHSCLVV